MDVVVVQASRLPFLLLMVQATPAGGAGVPPATPSTPAPQPPPDPPRRRPPGWRLRLRWALATLPLIVMTLATFAGALHTHTLGYEAFETAGRRPDRYLALLGVLLPLYWVAGYVWAWAHDGQTPWDWVSGVELRRRATAEETQKQGRGFEVLPPRVAPSLGP